MKTASSTSAARLRGRSSLPLSARRAFCTIFLQSCVALPCVAQVEDWKTGIEADRLLLTESGAVFWKANCESAGSGITRIRTASMSTGSESMILQRASCTAANQIRGGITFWGDRVFYVDSEGWVKRDQGSTIVRSADPARISTYGEIARTSGYIFWTDEEGEFLDGGRLWRAPYNGGTPELVADYNSSPRAGFRQLMAVSDSRMIALRTDGVLVNMTLMPGLPPFGIPFWLRSTIASNVGAACLRNASLYWVSFSGTTGTFRSAPVADTSLVTSLGTQATVAGQQIYELAHGDGKLWYPITTCGATTSSELLSRSATVSGAAALRATVPCEIKQLMANDRYVCWIKNGNAISRLPTGTAAITRNLTIERPSDAPSNAPFLEIIQSVQNARNENPLVADKTTHVRAYARIAASSTGEASLMPAPPVVLHGTRGGVALPGSPLAPSLFPSPPAPLGTVQGVRSSMNAGYWFRLPPAWTTEGSIALSAEVNASRTLAETSYTDNVSSGQLATFTQKAPIGMKIIPTLTHFGAIERYSPAYQEFFDQLESLLATSDLRFEFCHDMLDEEHAAWDHSPFEFRPDDNDDEKVNWGLGWKKVFGSGGQLAEPGGYDHYVAMLPEASHEGVGFSGVAWPGDEVSITVSQSLFFIRPERSGIGVRSDATTQAQEISHNYGLRHVDCNGPDPASINILHPYPYANDELSSAAAGYQGFDPLHNRLIGRTAAKDYMGYCTPKWVSDHAWKRMFARVSTGHGPRDAGGSTQCLTGGFLDVHGGIAEMRPAWRMGAAEAARAARAIPPVNPAYQLRAWQGNTLKSTIPVRTSDPLADQGHVAGEQIAWLAVPGDLAGVDRLELATTDGGQSLGVIRGGGAAPVVSVTAPTSGAVISAASFEIKWNSIDDNPGAPLPHMVRFSHDNGNTWRLLRNNFAGNRLVVRTADVPGGQKCRVEVAASDGILSTSALSGEFSIANKAPGATFFFENARGKLCVPLATATVDCGEPLALHAEVSDLEDGWLSESDIAWSVTGPVTRTGTGRLWRPEGLAPGTYTVALAASDSSGASGTAVGSLIVRPAYVENAVTTPVLDGIASDNSYTVDRIAKPLRYASGALAEVRMVHRGAATFIAASGLLPGTYGDSRLAIGFDMDNSGGAPGAGDLLVTVHQFGAVRLFNGNGSGWTQDENATDITGATGGDSSRWSVEIAVPDTRFTLWNGRTVRAFIAHLDRNALFDHTPWASGTLTDLSSWTRLVLGADPEDPTDSDRDGMPDSWELTNFGSLGRTAATDTDGDGQLDAVEFTAGTDPRSSTARFRALTGGSRGSLSWNSAPGRSYTVWRSPDLNAWTPVAAGIAAAGASTAWTDSDPLAGKAFYRIEAHYCR